MKAMAKVFIFVIDPSEFRINFAEKNDARKCYNLYYKMHDVVS